MKGRFSLNRILHNNRLMIVISLVLAIILWAGVVYGSGSNEKRHINLGTYTLRFADNSYAKETGLSIIPVSYTHLDVYKRQGCCSCCSIRINCFC